MKNTMWRVLAICLACMMLLGCLTACGGGDQEEEQPGLSGPVEVGTEEELTAVRDSLIKATETKGFGDIAKMEFYENGGRTTSETYVQANENKKFYYNGQGIKRLVN